MWTKIKRRGKDMLFGLVSVILLAGCSSFSQTPEPLPTVTPTPDPLALQCIPESGRQDFCYAGDLLAEDTELLEKAAQTFCLNNDDFFCYIFIWNDEESVAHSYPLTDAEEASMIATFVSRPNSGLECFKTYSNGEETYSSGDCN